MPRKVFTAGEVLAAAEVNEFLMDQAVQTFAGTAARGSALPTPSEGMLTYLADSDTFEFFDGSSFVSLVTESPTVEYVVVAGGGGGGVLVANKAAGGGGAGGYRTNVAGALSGGSAVAELPMAFVAGTYLLTVGAGGTKTTIDNESGSAGFASIFGDIACIGGGRGTTFNRNSPVGGSGGGGHEGSNGSPGFYRQGFIGGQSSSTGGGGGGGAASTGVVTTTARGGNGGAGLANSITGTSVSRAGGGGGGGANTSGGTGGVGGGGNGSIDTNAAGNGGVNTGGGGGGAEQAGGGSGTGGSGVVIFSVPTSTTVTFTGGVTQTNSTVSGRQVYVVTATTTTSETVTFS